MGFESVVGTIFKYFSVIAIFISCLGLFGLAAFMVGQRTKESGIRRVLGASRSYIMLILCREFLILILTFLTISIQTLKATRINPVEALRYE